MFPPTTTPDAAARRTLSGRLRDAFSTAIEFATLGEATLDPSSTTKVRFVRAEEVLMAPVPLPAGLLGPTPAPVPPATAAGRAAAKPVMGKRAPVAPHPHRLALQRPVRGRRPGAVPPLPPVCTMPVNPTPAADTARKGVTGDRPSTADHHTPRN